MEVEFSPTCVIGAPLTLEKIKIHTKIFGLRGYRGLCGYIIYQSSYILASYPSIWWQGQSAWHKALLIPEWQVLCKFYKTELHRQIILVRMVSTPK